MFEYGASVSEVVELVVAGCLFGRFSSFLVAGNEAAARGFLGAFHEDSQVCILSQFPPARPVEEQVVPLHDDYPLADHWDCIWYRAVGPPVVLWSFDIFPLAQLPEI